MDARYDHRRWLVEAEMWCNFFKDIDLDRFHFHMGRRRYFLSRLLSKQIKEFKHDPPLADASLD